MGQQQRLLIVGGGMAGVRLIEEIVRLDPRRYAITIVGAEPRPGYNRVLLSALLAQDVGESDIRLKEAEWYRGMGVRLITGDPVIAVDSAARTATLGSGEVLAFDRCVFATGSQAVRLPLPGSELAGVITFRDVEDVAQMEAAAVDRRKIAVIGGGLLGIEAAYGLAKRGADVTLVHVMDSLMERQLDGRAAEVLKRAIEAKGVKVLLGRQTTKVLGDERVAGLAFADGTQIPADMVVFAVGIRPNVAVAKAAGLPVGRGIVVDDALASPVDGFHAIGECAEHGGQVYGLVEPAYQQAAVLASALCGRDAGYGGTLMATNLKVSGVPVFSAGEFNGADGDEVIVAEDRRAGVYKKLVLRGRRLAGVVLVGEADDALWYLDLVRSGADVSAMRQALMFGPAYAAPERRAA
jgi:nitrite reductase (NADH) large subunit